MKIEAQDGPTLNRRDTLKLGAGLAAGVQNPMPLEGLLQAPLVTGPLSTERILTTEQHGVSLLIDTAREVLRDRQVKPLRNGDGTKGISSITLDIGPNGDSIFFSLSELGPEKIQGLSYYYFLHEVPDMSVAIFTDTENFNLMRHNIFYANTSLPGFKGVTGAKYEREYMDAVDGAANKAIDPDILRSSLLGAHRFGKENVLGNEAVRRTFGIRNMLYVHDKFHEIAKSPESPKLPEAIDIFPFDSVDTYLETLGEIIEHVGSDGIVKLAIPLFNAIEPEASTSLTPVLDDTEATVLFSDPLTEVLALDNGEGEVAIRPIEQPISNTQQSSSDHEASENIDFKSQTTFNRFPWRRNSL